MWPGLKLTSLSDSLFKSLFRLLFRYDIFISYARGDGKDYAIKLRDQLKQLDFSCFLDFDELPPGNSLNNTLKRAIRKSATLVIVGTERAVKSRYVELEVGEFANTGRAIIPIDIEGTLAETPWRVIKERDIVWIDEIKGALAKGVPSPTVADSIDKLFKYTRRNSRVRAQVLSTIILFVVVVAASIFLIRQQVSAATRASAEAERQKIEAKNQKAVADTASAEATKQRIAADMATNKAAIATGKAEESQKKATIAEKAAGDATREARKQETMALANAKKAKAEQARAEERTRYVLAQQMGVQADIARDTGNDLEGSVLLSVESLKRALTPEGYISWERGMELLPQRAKMEFDQNGSNVTALAYNPDGSLLAMGASDGTVTLFQTSKRRELVPLPNKLNSAASVITFGRDGRWIAAASRGGPTGQSRGEIRIWDLKTFQPIRLDLHNLPRISEAESIAFSPDGRYLAMADREASARVIDLANGSLVAQPRVDGAGYVMSVAFSTDSKLLAIGCIPGRIGLWDVTSFAKGIEATREPAASAADTALIHSIIFSSEGHYLAALDNNGGVGIWEISADGATLQLSKSSQMPGVSTRGLNKSPVVFSRGEDYIATARNDTARVWEVRTGREISRIGHGKPVEAIAFSPDGHLLVTASEEVNYWKMEFGSGAKRIAVHDKSEEKLSTLAISPGGEWLVTGSSDGARVFQTSDWSQIKTLGSGDDIANLTFSSDGRWLTTASKDKLRVFDTNLWKELKVVIVPDELTHLPGSFNSDEALDVSFSPDGRWLVLRTGILVKLLEYGSWRERQPMQHSDRVSEVFFSPDGRWMGVRTFGHYLGGSGRHIPVERERTYVWDTSTGLPMACRTDKDETLTTSSNAPAAVCPEISGNQQRALLSQVPNWKEVLRFAGLTSASLDGHWLVESEGGVKLSEVDGKTSRQVATLMPGASVEAMTFSRDSRWLVIADDDSLTLWPLKPTDMINAACERLRRRDLTLDEWKRYFSGEKLQPTCVPAQP